MAYLKVDDNVSHHRKLLRAGDVAAWLFICGLAYCQRHATDGFIPEEAVPFLGCAGWRQALPKLTEPCPRPAGDDRPAVGLWAVVPGGYQVHDFLDWNDSAAERRAKTDASNERVTRYRERMKRVTNGAANASPSPTPSPTPVQERTNPPKSGGPAQAWKRGLAIAHKAIETHPASMADQADWFKATCAAQGIDYTDRGGDDQRPLYTRALDAALESRARRARRGAVTIHTGGRA